MTSHVDETGDSIDGKLTHHPSFYVYLPITVLSYSKKTLTAFNVSLNILILGARALDSRMSALESENEVLRAKYGSMGLAIDRSMEGDALDVGIQMTSLQMENESLKRGLQDFGGGWRVLYPHTLLLTPLPWYFVNSNSLKF